MFVLKLKTFKMGTLCGLMYWQPMVLFGRTMKGHISLVDPSSVYHNMSFSFRTHLSSWMYVEVVDIRNQHSHPFLKQDALWLVECSSYLYLSKSSRTCLFPPKQSFSKAQPFSMWYVKVCAAISNLSLESGIIVSGLLSCNLMLGMTVSLHCWRQLFIMSDEEIILPQSEHDISPPWILVHNSLWRVCWKVHGSCSWNNFLNRFLLTDNIIVFNLDNCVWCIILHHNLQL